MEFSQSVRRQVGVARVRRPVLWLALVSMVAGCTGLESASFPRSAPDLNRAAGPTRTLKVGDNVRIGLKTGEMIKGEVVAVTAESVKVVRIGNYGRQEYELNAGEISTVERVTGGTAWMVFVGFTVGVVVILTKSFLDGLD